MEEAECSRRAGLHPPPALHHFHPPSPSGFLFSFVLLSYPPSFLALALLFVLLALPLVSTLTMPISSSPRP